jgi:hypothetical protein
MVTLLPLHRKAIDKAEVQYRQLDSERYIVHTEVHRLTKSGLSAKTIGDLLSISERQVQRIRGSEEPPQRFYEFNTSDSRVRDLDRTINAVLDLACRIKDEDPQIVFKTLELLDEDALRELLMTALAGMPVDMTPEQLFGWCQP